MSVKDKVLQYIWILKEGWKHLHSSMYKELNLPQVGAYVEYWHNSEILTAWYLSAKKSNFLPPATPYEALVIFRSLCKSLHFYAVFLYSIYTKYQLV